MARTILQVWGLTLLVGLLGALLGYGWELVSGQAGWTLVLASMGLCGGAAYAGSLVTRTAAERAASGPAAPTEPTAPSSTD
jgi:hypothetical protein